MNRILEIDEANLVCVTQPGVVVETLQTEVEKVGLFYPPDPASRGSCMIGGNIAENAGGPRAVKYGVTKDYVMGVEAVLPNGDVIRAGGKRYKDVTGYNLTQLFVGSEGTLGVVTEATLRLLPKPTETATVLAAYDSIDDAARTVPEIFKRGIFPTAAEFMERDAIAASAAHLGISFPHQDAEAHLLLMVDGNDRERVVAEATRIGEACLEMGARDAILADNPARERGLWALRRAVGEAVKKLSNYKEEDTVAPRAALPALIRGVKEIARRHGVRAICYGHAGDGNIHCNIVKGDLSDRDWNERLPTAIEEIFRHTVSLGGTISGEHGIGWSQKRYLHLAMSPAELALLARVKAAFDPKGILNPGKVIPEGIGGA
ncbi:MAG: FAD-binding protein, partial [Candidatus Methylomirabilis sp.]|nr:FAD-binding protein [Deltaproteobacteria bacterium]